MEKVAIGFLGGALMALSMVVHAHLSDAQKVCELSHSRDTCFQVLNR